MSTRHNHLKIKYAKIKQNYIVGITNGTSARGKMFLLNLPNKNTNKNTNKKRNVRSGI